MLSFSIVFDIVQYVMGRMDIKLSIDLRDVKLPTQKSIIVLCYKKIR